MGQTYWYAYSGRVEGPFFETKAEAAEACSDGESPRPVSADVIDSVEATAAESTADDSDASDESDDAGDVSAQTRRESQISRGVCPWCDAYDGEHVGRHASSAHTEKWNRFKDKRDD